MPTLNHNLLAVNMIDRHSTPGPVSMRLCCWRQAMRGKPLTKKQRIGLWLLAALKWAGVK